MKRGVAAGLVLMTLALSATEPMLDGRSQVAKQSGYAPVNGLRMYYEIEGNGPPLVFIPPVFGIAGQKSFPLLTQGRTVITMDLQGNGRTADLPDRPLSVEQNAKDVLALLDFLKIGAADFIGESYGAASVLKIAIDHPERVRRAATYGGAFGPPAVAHNSAMLHFDRPPSPDSPGFRFQREAYEKVAPHPDGWAALWQKSVAISWRGFSEHELGSIRVPVLILVGDHDFVRVEHAVETSRLIPGAELAVIPDAGHFVLYSEPDRVIPIIRHFLEQPASRLPVATAAAGYYPGVTR